MSLRSTFDAKRNDAECQKQAAEKAKQDALTAAANTWLEEKALHLREELERAVADGQKTELMLGMPPGFGMRERETVMALPGFQKLQDICSSPAVDMALAVYNGHISVEMNKSYQEGLRDNRSVRPISGPKPNFAPKMRKDGTIYI